MEPREKLIILVQRQTGHEPDTWEDIVIPDEHQHYSLIGMAQHVRITKGEGRYRMFDRRGELHDVQMFEVKQMVVNINGATCEEAGT